MMLLPNEQIIKQSSNNEFTLTNLRIRQHYSEWNRFYTADLFLENISSIESSYKGWTLLLIIGALAAASGILMAISVEEIYPLVAFLVGIILIGLWYSTRKVYVIIASNGGASLRFPMDKNRQIHSEMVFNVEMAKINRIKQLYNSKY